MLKLIKVASENLCAHFTMLRNKSSGIIVEFEDHPIAQEMWN